MKIGHAIRSGVAVAVFGVALACGAAGRADAESYVVHACRLPDGSPASTVGWTSRSQGDAVVSDTCQSGGSLAIAFRYGALPTTEWFGPWAEWTFDAPPDTRISSYSIYRYVRTHLTPGPPPEASEYMHYTDARVWQFGRDYCNPSVCRQVGSNPGFPRDPGNRLQVDGVDHGRIGFHLICWRSDGFDGCPSWTSPLFVLYAADVTLRDVHAPAVTNLSGQLSGFVEGTRTVSVTGLDRGAGLYAVRLLVDGTAAAEQSFAAAKPTCAHPFVEPVPCPLSGTARVPLDTSVLSDGHHQLQAVLIDAAGNETPSAAYSILVDNAGASCVYGNMARLRVRFRRNKKARIRVHAGRMVAVSGRLRASDGKPVPAAAIRVFVRDKGAPRYRQTKVLTTRRNGWFRMLMRAAASRRVRVAYCAPGGGASRVLRMEVAASSEIQVHDRTLRNGQSMRLSGKLLGRRIPRDGKLVEIQAFFRGRWRTISTVRSDAQGEWAFRYRFDGTSGRVVYRFRAFLPEEAGYPYESGKSRQLRVVVIGP